MSSVIPAFRHDVSVNVHSENGETFLVLHDPFGFADGPIMIHSDMIDILDVCDGETTFEELASSSELGADSKEMLRLRAFVGQLDEMGFLEGERSAARRKRVLDEWSQLTVRPAVCAGSTYPSEPEKLRELLARMTGERSQPAASKVVAALIPHIDYRVAENAYRPGFNAIRDSDADLFVIVGTSHYWSENRIVLTQKDYATPLGTISTDKQLVKQLAQVLDQETDLAHKPEHSIELHAVFLKYLFEDRPFTILPILVSGYTDVEDQDFHNEMRELGALLARTISLSERNVMWLISGDLSHVGKKFGDDVPAIVLESEVLDFDRMLLDSLEKPVPETFHRLISLTDNRYRVCGHAPVLLTLEALSRLHPPLKGTVAARDIWHEEETQSMVSFGTVLFSE
jgi:AmmeMemoRadiSam system protein B